MVNIPLLRGNSWGQRVAVAKQSARLRSGSLTTTATEDWETELDSRVVSLPRQGASRGRSKGRTRIMDSADEEGAEIRARVGTSPSKKPKAKAQDRVGLLDAASAVEGGQASMARLISGLHEPEHRENSVSTQNRCEL